MKWMERWKRDNDFFGRILDRPAEKETADLDPWQRELKKLGTTLLTLLQQYRWEIEEIQAAVFLDEVNQFKAWLPGANRPEAIDDRRQRFYERSVQHLRKERKYLEEREQELKTMISVLSEAITSISTGNEDYHRKITQTTQTLSQISQLEDIRKIRSSLTNEISRLKEAVREKQSKEKEQYAELSSSVEALQVKLTTAVNRSLRDPLTGLYNRNGWDQEMVEACHVASVTQKPFAVALVDVDNFKKINDTGGHQVGDLILVKIAESFKASFRAEDFTARFGGDEFAIILSLPTLDKAHRRLDRFCQEISKPTYQCPVEGQQYYVKISISVGVSLYRLGDSPASLVRRADESLYLAKKAGKNQVMTELALEAKTA